MAAGQVVHLASGRMLLEDPDDLYRNDCQMAAMTNLDNDTSTLIPVEGRQVTRCLVDHAFGFELWTSESIFEFKLYGPFDVLDNGARHFIDPENTLEVGRALAILHRGVLKAGITKDGKLWLDFTGDISVAVEAQLDNEAWEIAGPAGQKWVCTPGGKVATWG